jgi:hypothetical protein
MRSIWFMLAIALMAVGATTFAPSSAFAYRGHRHFIHSDANNIHSSHPRDRQDGSRG